MLTTEIKKERLKISIICKDVQQYEINEKIIHKYKPKVGDVAIFEVLQIGKHPSIQGTNGNSRAIYPGDWIMCAFGNRYATGQIEGYVPEGPLEIYDILGKGGVVGQVKTLHAGLLKKGPTQLKMIGYVQVGGKVFNTLYRNQPRMKFSPSRPLKSKIILSLGASMDSGKTTSAAFLCKGILNAGHRVAYFKLTGTVYSKDRAMVRDCGAMFSADFSFFGYPSTYMCSRAELLDLFDQLVEITEQDNPEYIVVEIADGLLQRETNMLLKHKPFLKKIHSVMFSGGDSLSALLGYQTLHTWGIYPKALSGLFTASPLLINEVKEKLNIPILTLDLLSSPEVIHIFEGETPEQNFEIKDLVSKL